MRFSTIHYLSIDIPILWPFYTPAYLSPKSHQTPFWIGLTDLDAFFCLLLLIYARSSYFMITFIRPLIPASKVMEPHFGLVWPIWIQFFAFFYLFGVDLPILWPFLYARISKPQKWLNPILDWFDRFGCGFFAFFYLYRVDIPILWPFLYARIFQPQMLSNSILD